jgi:hypothetical protein
MTFARLALAGLLCCAACSKKAEPARRTEPWLAHPSANADADTDASRAPLTFHFASGSSIRFSVPGRKAKLSGRVPLGDGALRLDPRDLKSTSAHIDVDLRQLMIDEETLPEGVELAGSTPTALALRWLELGTDVTPERRSELSKARFELTSIDALSAPVLELGTTRTNTHVSATAIGTLLIHGFRAPVRVEVLLAPLRTEPRAPLRLSIRSASALVLTLAPHDITARGPSGIVDTLGAARAAEWVGKNARIEFDLVAEADRVPN